MYHPVEVANLSSNQVSKLLKGQAVRVKSGKGHVVHLSSEQLKKHHKSAMKGAGYTLTLDPYQMAQHAHLKGSGIMSHAKKALKKAGHFVKAHKEHFRPLASHLKNVGHQAIADATMYAAEQGIDPNLVSAYSSMAHEAIPMSHGGSLKSFSRGLSHFVKTPAMRAVRRTLKPLGQMALNDAMQLGEMGLNQGMNTALGSMTGMPVGMGLRKRVGRPRKAVHGFGVAKAPKKAPKSVGRPRGRPRRGGALYPAGY